MGKQVVGGASRDAEHQQLVERAARWLKANGCKLVMAETVTGLTSEVPDAIGWRGEDSIMIECKTSRADFRADAAKPFRLAPGSGMGRFRYYLCPAGLIAPEELPERWGLLYVEGRRVSVQRGPDLQAWPGNLYDAYSFPERNVRAETGVLLSAIGRLRKGLGIHEFERLIGQAYYVPTGS